MVYYVSSYDIFSSKTLSGAASESGERQKAIFAENRTPRADFLRIAPNGIGGQEFIPGSRGFRGSRGNGVRSRSSDPPKHAQESQDDVSSQQTPSKYWVSA